MPPIQLPIQPAGGIPLPPQPHDPPTLADVFLALDYQSAVDSAFSQPTLQANHNSPSNNDKARAEVYKTEVVMAHSPSAEPAWFTQAITPVKMLLAKTRNYQLGDGQFSSFEIVPFVDGSMPQNAPNNLPALVNLTQIRNLSAVESNAYCAGYGLANPGELVTRRRLIANFIGSSVRL